jgi:hypothetical protein
MRNHEARTTMRKGAGPAARAAVLAMAAAVLLGSGACSEKITSVDPGFTAPEGAPSPQTALMMWHEIPNKLYIFIRGEVNPDCPAARPDVLVDSVTIATPLPGQLHAAILDSTPANAYQVFRRESNGGYRELFDFTPSAERKWFDRGWEAYHIVDPDTALPSRTYRGRGVVGGAVTVASPLTNEASHNQRAVERITYTGATGFDQCGTPTALDSLFLMEWKPVPGAAAYVIHVYQWSFSLTQLEEQISSGMPAPLYIGKSVDILVAYMPAPNPSPATITFRMPTPGARPPEARIMTVRQTRYGQEYIVRIAAVDALGQLIAYTYGSYSQELTGIIPGGIALPSSQFAVFRLGGVKVVPKRPTAPLLRARPGGTAAP